MNGMAINVTRSITSCSVGSPLDVQAESCRWHIYDSAYFSFKIFNM